jgi:hypothetical protein
VGARHIMQRNAIIDEITSPRSFGYLHLLLAAIAGAVVGAVVVGAVLWQSSSGSGSSGSGSLEECVLREMRGQPAESISYAHELCRRRLVGQPSSLEECVLREMRGQPAQSISYARELCRRR